MQSYAPIWIFFASFFLLPIDRSIFQVFFFSSPSFLFFFISLSSFSFLASFSSLTLFSFSFFHFLWRGGGGTQSGRLAIAPDLRCQHSRKADPPTAMGAFFLPFCFWKRYPTKRQKTKGFRAYLPHPPILPPNLRTYLRMWCFFYINFSSTTEL
ncbi:hypothetical protein DFH27DRAFT_356213 [Peziza echinospora]|nr:hypothetical protein DFH27DRAFT_356213 [Peziza echinospora]